jgi:hypothetical protein
LKACADIEPELIALIELCDYFKYRRWLGKLTLGERTIAAEEDPRTK